MSPIRVKTLSQEEQKKTRPKIKRREVVDGKPKLGRPKKADIQKKKKPGIVGRPVGDAGRIAEFKARLLATAGDSVITKIIEISQDDNHPGQMAALKMCVDRVLPLSYFDKDKTGGSMPQISINITSLGEPKIEQANVIDRVDITDVQYNDE